MAKFKVNKEMFGKYVIIPTGYSKEPHIYKVVNSIYSNSYCDVPIVYNSEPTPHDKIETTENPYGLETVLNVIHCGLDETKVIRVAFKDCKVVEPKTNADRIRAMSDEELADMLHNIGSYVENGEPKIDIYIGENESTVDDSFGFILAWLQSEVEE